MKIRDFLLLTCIFGISLSFGQKEKKKLVYKNIGCLDIIPDSVFLNESIQVLRIVGSTNDYTFKPCADISKIPRDIIKLKKLEKLSLVVTEIERIPKFLARLKYLNNLDLTSNRRLKYFRALRRIKSLRSLHLNDCNLKVIPKSIYKLSHLEVLGLGANFFSEKTKEELQGKLPNTKIYF